MIFHGTINRIEKLNMKDDPEAELYDVRMTDSSIPPSLRSSGEFVTYLSGEKRKLLPKGDEVYDSKVTIIVREISPGRGGSIKIKGDIQPGILPVDKLVDGSATKVGPPPSKG